MITRVDERLGVQGPQSHVMSCQRVHTGLGGFAASYGPGRVCLARDLEQYLQTKFLGSEMAGRWGARFPCSDLRQHMNLKVELVGHSSCHHETLCKLVGLRFESVYPLPRWSACPPPPCKSGSTAWSPCWILPGASELEIAKCPFVTCGPYLGWAC